MSTPSVPVPLPPMPPPPLTNRGKPEPLQISENLESSKIRHVLGQCKKIVFDQIVSHTNDQRWILCNTDVTPKLQGSAPRCGLVALSMAAEMTRLAKETKLPPTPLKTLKYDNSESELTALISLAKHLSFSSHGEMFSATNLSVLAKQFYGLETTVTAYGFDNLNAIVNHLYQGNPLLVPYDASPNHEPCLANGYKSHWAVLTGFFCNFDDRTYDWSKLQESCSIANLQIEESFSTIYTLNKPVPSELPNNLNMSSLYFLARQPKSRHVALWPWKLLQESNANLFEYSKDTEREIEFVFHEGGVYEGLCEKIIYLW